MPRRTAPVEGDTLGQKLVAALILRSLRLSRRAGLRGDSPVGRQRRLIRTLAKATVVPGASTFAPGSVGGVPGEWAAPKSGQQSGRRIVLYLHGGAYCIGSPATHRALTGRLALASSARVLALDYRLAPEHPFPAALEDACAAYDGLLASGSQPADIVIAGDSAGGGLSVATALRLRSLGRPSPAALLLFCPWADLRPRQSAAGLSATDEFPRDWITRDWTNACADMYLSGHDPTDPYASPLHGELAGLPPTLIQVGGDDTLREDAERLHARMRAAGVDVCLSVYPRRWHDFQLHGGLLRDAHRAVDEAAAHVRAHACR